MAGNALLTDTLKDAGITLKNCKSIVSLFDDEEKNLRVSILTRFLNSKIQVIASQHIRTYKSILDTDIGGNWFSRSKISQNLRSGELKGVYGALLYIILPIKGFPQRI